MDKHTPEPVAKYSDIVSDGGMDPRNKFDVHPPNEDGKTNCIIRWMTETPSGWVGSWDRAALEQFTQPRKWQEIECPCCGDLARAFPPAPDAKRMETDENGCKRMQPAREWVGLTEDEIYFAIRPLYCDDSTASRAVAVSVDEYRVIEKALKDKNT